MTDNINKACNAALYHLHRLESNNHCSLVIPEMCILRFTCLLYTFFRHSKSSDSLALEHSETIFESFLKILHNYCRIF